MNDTVELACSPHPLSFADPNGRLFSVNGELHRGISPDQSPRFEAMMRDGTIRSLVDSGFLIETEFADRNVPKFDLTLRHRRIEPLSFPTEWCGEMLRSAALLIARLQIDLHERGLTLQDAHPNNVVFDSTRPIFVDIGSIGPGDKTSSWGAYDEFRRHLLYPLQLMARGHGRIARLLLGLRDGVSERELEALAPDRGLPVQRARRMLYAGVRRAVPSYAKAMVKGAISRVQPYGHRTPPPVDQAALLKATIAQIENLEFPTELSPWLNYAAGKLCLEDKSDWAEKQLNIEKMLNSLRPRSVLDVGCNTGWYSVLATRFAHSVVAVDGDDACANALFLRARAVGLPILPLVMDFRQLPVGKVVCSTAYLAPAERLGSELVIASGLLHHLVFKGLLTFEHIVTGLADFSKRCLIVEFVPREDGFVSNWWSERFGWYTLENFQGCLRRHFNSVEILPSSPAPRLLLLCQK